MNPMAMMQGARLSYVVVEIEGTVRRKVHKWTKGKGLIENYVEEPGGYLVYFPRGHVLRLKDKAALRHYQLHKQPRIVNMDKLTDPNTPMGKLMLAQDEATRRGAMEDLEKAVIRLATAQSGRIEVVRDQAELDDADKEAA